MGKPIPRAPRREEIKKKPFGEADGRFKTIKENEGKRESYQHSIRVFLIGVETEIEGQEGGEER